MPYFQGKESGLYIKFYKAIGITVVIDLQSQAHYSKLITEITTKANFLFKYCTDYNSPIVYNYITSSNNKIRFNYSKKQISIEYPSELGSFMETNSENLPVFVCISNDAYAYHTNLKCEGLGNCEKEVAKTNIKEAKKFKYQICEICTSDY